MHLTARRDREKWVTMHFIIFTLSVFAFFSCPHVGRPTIGTKSFDSASNSILFHGPTGYMTNRSSCCRKRSICPDIQVISIHRHKRLKSKDIMEEWKGTYTKSFQFFIIGKKAKIQEKISFYHTEKPLCIDRQFSLYVKNLIGHSVFLF